jgi:septum formation protein maf
MPMLILASKSPRRKELLKQIGIPFVVVVSDAEEVSGNSWTPAALVVENAKRKARAVAEKYPDSPVLGADTVVSSEGKIFGKPKDKDEARKMLTALSGKMHEVTTGLALINRNEIRTTNVTTKVFFDTMTKADIDAYIATEESMDKAGAYAIQGKAARFIEKIEGSYSNVVGLPLNALIQLSKDLNLFPLAVSRQ